MDARGANQEAEDTAGINQSGEKSCNEIIDENPVVSDSASSSSNIIISARKLESTVEGMIEVTRRWSKNEIVAIPTECTYEACISLRTSRTNAGRHTSTQSTAHSRDWAYRIGRVRQVAALGVCSGNTSASNSVAPYCWVPRSADCPLLRDCLPARYYGMRDTNGRARVAHRFNETHEVVQRLARHLWPGPVTMSVAVSVSEGNVTKPANLASRQLSCMSTLLTSFPQADQLETGICSCSYLTLRCPQHPLAIKVAEEHLRESHEKHSGVKGDDEASATGVEDCFSVLVGFPVVKEQTRTADNKTRFCRSSSDVRNKYKTCICCTTDDLPVDDTVSAVLDGENHSELFSVPTCEYGEPSHCQVWIDGPSRTVTLFKGNCSEENAAARGESNTPSVLPFGVYHQTGSLGPSVSATRLTAALRQRIQRRPPLPKEKDQIVQAILCRWKVVEAKRKTYD